MRDRDRYRFAVYTDANLPVLAAKIRKLRDEYNLTLKQIAIRFSIAESTAHKLYHSPR